MSVVIRGAALLGCLSLAQSLTPSVPSSNIQTVGKEGSVEGVDSHTDVQKESSADSTLQFKTASLTSDRKKAGGMNLEGKRHTSILGVNGLLDGSEYQLEWQKRKNLKSVSDCPYKEEKLMPNDGGSSYVGQVWVGYKFFRCLWDTGSFDLQMVSHKCTSCRNTTDLYERSYSKTHELLQLSNGDDGITEIQYGSGPATIQRGFDRVGLFSTGSQTASCQAQHTPVGEILRTSIQELTTADRRFEGVCGIAPGPVEKEDQRLIKKLGIDRVGFCFNQDVEQPGYARWNIGTEKSGFHYSTNPNVGYYWAIRVKDFRFRENSPGSKETIIGCPNSSPCLGLMDTGTSLHSVDNSTLHQVYKALNDLDGLECTDSILESLPSLVYSDDNGRDLVVTPHDYLITVDEDEEGNEMDFHSIPADIRKQLFFHPGNMPSLLQKQKGKPQCVLALSDSGEDGMHIFGMPYFRHNQVVLDITRRSVSLAAHDGNCNPPKHQVMAQISDKKVVQKLRKVPVDSLRMSKAALRMQEAKKKGARFVKQAKTELGFFQL